MKIFHICTIANKLEQYKEMRDSFIKAGFDENKCRYTLFDNSNGNIYEPYTVFNQIKQNTIEPYIIFCHQDILLDQGHGFKQLVQVIEELNLLDSKWAIVGNAGFNSQYKQIVRIKDPNNLKQWDGEFPQQVHSLDENFLVIKTSANISCSHDLKGFHFYATDLCLNSIINGYSCYVIDFYITHLSAGNFDNNFWNFQIKFKNKWNNEFAFLYIKATGTPMFFSKYKVLRKFFGSKKFINFLLSNKMYILMNITLKLRMVN